MSGTVCVIGLGSMGYGAAVTLLRAGVAVRGVDVREDALASLRQEGGEPAATPAEGASGADAVITFVVDADQTEEVLLGEHGAAMTMNTGSGVVIACATVAPARAERLAARLAERGCTMLDAPVSGGATGAATGELTVMASGSAEAFRRADPYLSVIAAKVYHLGEEPGQGSRVKMINQLLAGVHIAATAEAMALGIRAGIDPDTLYEVISNSAGSSWMFRNRAPHILAGDYTATSAVDIFVKDLGIVLETGRSLTFPLPLAASAHQLFTMASAQGLGREDDSAVIKVYAANTGIPLPGADG
ncbi:MAG TPA: L-threonate dehydrogenase [Candidatus Dormibacteraeota bacterium]|jgi:3-hydroxyisobutyrate dehydrogenase|nr:L-threonate dehydrogenase [Candidatus Dormibacteraeota bacterium]